MDVYAKLKKLGLEIPPPPPSGGIYASVKPFCNGKLLYLSGMGPIVDGKPYRTGKVGTDLTLEEGMECAKICGLNMLSALQAHLGDLNKIKNCVKLLGFVASKEDFYDQPQVMNSCSQLFIDLFGDGPGRPARSAIGTNVLPINLPVEVEGVFEIE